MTDRTPAHPAVVVTFHWPGGIRMIHAVYGPYDTAEELREATRRAEFLYAKRDIDLRRLESMPPDPVPPRRVGGEGGGG